MSRFIVSKGALACAARYWLIGMSAAALMFFVHWAVGLVAVPLLLALESWWLRRSAAAPSCGAVR